MKILSNKETDPLEGELVTLQWWDISYEVCGIIKCATCVRSPRSPNPPCDKEDKKQVVLLYKNSKYRYCYYHEWQIKSPRGQSS